MLPALGVGAVGEAALEYRVCCSRVKGSPAALVLVPLSFR